MVITYMVNDTFIWNTATIYRYGILAFGSMMCIYRIFNHCVQYLVHRGGTQLYLWNIFTLLDSISCHNIIIRILQSNKCWPVLFLWIQNIDQIVATQLPLSHECMGTKWLQWLVIDYCHACIAHLIGLSVRNNVFLFLDSASVNIHHPLIETKEIMELTVFATLRRLHQFINFASFLHDCH